MSDFEGMIDIRHDVVTKPRYIMFSTPQQDYYSACRLNRFNNGTVDIEDDLGDNQHVSLHSLEHAQNLIRALEKAIELEWFTK